MDNTKRSLKDRFFLAIAAFLDGIFKRYNLEDELTPAEKQHYVNIKKGKLK